MRKEEVRNKIRSESKVARLEVAKQVASEMMVRREEVRSEVRSETRGMMKRRIPNRVLCGDVESADERCAVCGELLAPNFDKQPEYWMQYPIVEPMLVDGVKLCDQYRKRECLENWLDQHKVVPIGKTACIRAQLNLF
ncbi:MAG: hypothetical protein KAX99_04315 [Azonexus sp.]|nr:hypothetical protein [Azonexus sp.]